MALHGYVRATKDLDVLVLLPAIRAQELADALNAAGFTMRDAAAQSIPVDVPRMVQATRELGPFPIWWQLVGVEVFAPRVQLQDEVLRRCVPLRLDDLELFVTTVEDLILLKMIFHRDKDLVDVRRLLVLDPGQLDFAYLEGWLPRTLETHAAQELREMLDRVRARR
jgi:hypothetical protein